MDRQFLLDLYPRLSSAAPRAAPAAPAGAVVKPAPVSGRSAERGSSLMRPLAQVVAKLRAREPATEGKMPAVGDAGGLKPKSGCLRFSTAAAPLVLHARVTTGAGGGPDKTILRSAAYADPQRLRMAAVYLHPHNDPGIEVLRQQARKLNCPFYALAEHGAIDIRAVAALLRLCRQLRVTVWHAHDYKTDWLGLLLRRWWPMRLVTTLHGFTRETLRTRLYYHLDNLALRRYEQVLAVSQPLVEHGRRLGIRPERLTYVPNGIDTQEFRRTRSKAAARAALGMAQDRLVIGVVGRLSPEKGPDRALELAARLRGEVPNLQLHFVGDGPMWKELQQLAQVLSVSDVRFWGWQTGLQRFYEAMDVLLLPSRTEGFPNVVLEAMAMGVPVAAADVGGVSELLNDGHCGLILSPHEEDWAAELGALLRDGSRREGLAERALQRVTARYSFERRMAAELAIYERVLRLNRAPLAAELALRQAA